MTEQATIQTSSTTDPKILVRIRALLAKAESTYFAGERDTYQARAFELLAKYGIDEALLAAEENRDETPTTLEIKIDNPYSARKANLLTWIGTELGCQNVVWSRGKVTNRVVLYGFASDLQRVEMLYTSLLLQATSQVLKIRPPWHVDESVQTYRSSWFHGFAAKVAHRIGEAEKAARRTAQREQEQAPTTTSTSVELVLVGRADRVQRFYEEMNPGIKKGRKIKARSRAAYLDGVNAGNQADIGQTRVGHERVAVTG